MKYIVQFGSIPPFISTKKTFIVIRFGMVQSELKALVEEPFYEVNLSVFRIAYCRLNMQLGSWPSFHFSYIRWHTQSPKFDSQSWQTLKTLKLQHCTLQFWKPPVFIYLDNWYTIMDEPRSINHSFQFRLHEFVHNVPLFCLQNLCSIRIWNGTILFKNFPIFVCKNLFLLLKFGMVHSCS